MKNPAILLSVTVGSAIFCGAIPAAATIESQTAYYGSSLDPLKVGSADFPAQLTFQKFDTSIGALTDIIISLTTQDYVQPQVINLGAASSFENASATATVSIIGLDGTRADATLETAPFSGSIAGGTPTSPSYALGSPVSSTVTASSHVSGANFSAYEWDGSQPLDYALNVTSSGTLSGFGSPNLYFGYAAESFGQVTISYYYTPSQNGAVPESRLTASVAGLAALGISMVSFIRQRKATI